MLKINLLPQEYREFERRTAGTYLMVAAGTVLSVSSLCIVAYLYFVILAGAETERNIVKEEFENLKPMAEYASDLEAEKAEFMQRKNIIRDIEATRIHWTRKLDQLCQVVSNRMNPERHCVWLKEMHARMNDSRQKGIDLKGYLSGDQYEQLSNFNEDLKNHDLFVDDFDSITNPTGTTVIDDKMCPPEAIEYAWTLNLRYKNTVAAKRPILKKSAGTTSGSENNH